MSTTAIAPEAPYDGSRIAQTLASFRSASGLDLAFGGPVRGDGTAIDITATCGAKGVSLRGLRVVNGEGLGGKTLQTRQPGSVDHYYTARGITHLYDTAVAQEQIQTVAALPILVDRAPRMLIYLASRSRLGLGGVWFDSLRPLIRTLEREILIDDEVRNRLSRLAPAPTSARSTVDAAAKRDLAERREMAAELTDLAGQVIDPEVRGRLEAMVRRLSATPGEKPAQLAPAVRLAAREVDVLRQVALGNSNREAAEALGIVESTVKSYLKSATRKLNANNRVHAVRMAREAGLID
ncbi:regulatory protein, luxR family [Nocardioides sp. YR527]|uniref:helix-turn-helix transcriptional regulator n=1 Tax=Nocardioides sp. YR527 TaxID=1881028 RepID=UPI0008921516|nr:LuxR C-terminal-related transcriptional regulator [Nocardioides sp. YR527]SDJ83312.1 regulatory protein, luxR family [Nocardioides sp. YR527]